MARYITTNLRFPEETYRELRYQASRRGTSLASIVRESVERYLGRGPESGGPPFGEDPADAWVGALDCSPGDESSEHDHYLYGWTKEADREAAVGHERTARPSLRRRSKPSSRGGVRAEKPADAVRVDRTDPGRGRHPRPGASGGRTRGRR